MKREQSALFVEFPSSRGARWRWEGASPGLKESLRSEQERWNTLNLTP
jgi:hypothetical protein